MASYPPPTNDYDSIREHAPLVQSAGNLYVQSGSPLRAAHRINRSPAVAETTTTFSQFSDPFSALNICCGIVSALILIAFIVVLGIFSFGIDSNCAEDIRTWALVSFWLLIGYTILILVLVTLNLLNDPQSPNMIVVGCSCLVASLALAMFFTAYIWGIVALFNSNTVTGCAGLYWLDVGMVSFVSLIVAVLICVCICACCVAFGNGFGSSTHDARV